MFLYFLKNGVVTLLILGLILFAVHLSAQDIFINEILASNQNGIADVYGETSDWIEMFNAGNADIDLADYRLTDDSGLSGGWIFPSITLPSGSYLLIWASGRDKCYPDTLHTNFKLDSKGEYLGLINPDGLMVDSLTFGIQESDISWGRYPDGSAAFNYFHQPTPGNPNQKDIFLSFSIPEGLYDQPVEVALVSSESLGEIRFTLTGELPKAGSDLYTQPLALTKCCVVRAGIFLGDLLVSPVETRTYIVQDDPQLPVLSIAMDPEDLWDPQSGIYVQWDKHGDYWERPIHLTMIENGAVQFTLPAGIRIHGDVSRGDDKKNFRIYFRSKYGSEALEYPLFSQKTIQSFKRLILYAPSKDQVTGGTNYTYITDLLTHSLWESEEGNISAYRPVSLYLNGEYWGLYWIRERVDRYYVESNFGILDMDLHRNGWTQSGLEINAGDAEYYYEMFNFIRFNDLSQEWCYEKVKRDYIHIDNYIDYHIMNIFAGNWDWPEQNLDRFRDRTGPDPRWQWIMWDTDKAWIWSYDINILQKAIRETDSVHPETLWSTVVLRQLLHNQEFKTHFINRFADLMNTILSTQNVYSQILYFKLLIKPEISRELKRWTNTENTVNWEFNTEYLKKFARYRPNVQRQQILDSFTEYQPYGWKKVTILPSVGEGKIFINTLTIDSLPWEGEYIGNIPILLKAIPAPGYVFSKWICPSLPTESTVEMIIFMNTQVQAEFEANGSTDTLVISEINYNSNSAFDSEDWIELYNPAGHAVDLTGWHFQDNDTTHDFILPAGVQIPPAGYLVLCRDTAAFGGLHPSVANIIGNFDFGLGSGGDGVRIKNGSDFLIDSLTYDNGGLWPEEPNGFGPTLELKDPGLDNTLPESWQASSGYGTPGTANSAGLPAAALKDSVVINEINYHSTAEFDPEDWLELTNISGQPIDLSGWHFQDSDNGHDFRIPANMFLDPDSFLVICDDTTAFDSLFASGIFRVGNFNFGLGSSKDQIRIRDEWGRMIDSVTYFSTSPWPCEPDGLGPTLELKNPFLDNHLFQNWQASAGHGTPGLVNSSGTGIIDDPFPGLLPGDYALSPNVPNPFNPLTRIRFQLPGSDHVTLTVYNTLGQEVFLLLDEKKEAGYHQVLWEGNDRSGNPVTSGVYIAVMKTASFYRSIKMLLIR